MKKFFIMAFCYFLIFGVTNTGIAIAPEKTVLNLNKALLGEANAMHRYELFAQKANQEGYHQIAKLFRAISMAETVHYTNHKAAILNIGAKPEITKFQKINVGTTKENLQSPIKGESYEQKTMYPEFIKQAQADKVNVAVISFTYADNAELQHEKLLEDALANFGKNKEMDYCVSRISGSTVAVIPSQGCPAESEKIEQFVKIK